MNAKLANDAIRPIVVFFDVIEAIKSGSDGESVGGADGLDDGIMVGMRDGV